MQTTTATKAPTADVASAAEALAQAVQASKEWKEMLSAQEAAEKDPQFSRMMARHLELSRIQNETKKRGQGLDGKSLVEFIALRDQIQSHTIYMQRQEAGNAVLRLLQTINTQISDQLGLDFASTVAPRRSGCCG